MCSIVWEQGKGLLLQVTRPAGHNFTETHSEHSTSFKEFHTGTLGPKGTGEQVVWTLHCTPLILSTDWCCWKDPSWSPQPRKHGEKLLYGIYQAILSNSYWALESFHPKTRWRRSARSSLATWPPCRCHNTEGNLEGATGLGLLLPHLDFHCPRQASYSRKEWASYGSKNNRRWV